MRNTKCIKIGKWIRWPPTNQSKSGIQNSFDSAKIAFFIAFPITYLYVIYRMVWFIRLSFDDAAITMSRRHHSEPTMFNWKWERRRKLWMNDMDSSNNIDIPFEHTPHCLHYSPGSCPLIRPPLQTSNICVIKLLHKQTFAVIRTFYVYAIDYNKRSNIVNSQCTVHMSTWYSAFNILITK